MKKQIQESVTQETEKKGAWKKKYARDEQPDGTTLIYIEILLILIY